MAAAEWKDSISQDTFNNEKPEDVLSSAPHEDEPQTQSVLARTAVDRTLYFLSNASNEILGLCIVGLGVGTYLVLGKLGLVLIGVVIGVVLHATWEGAGSGDGRQIGEAKTSEVNRRREVGLDVVRRVLDWRLNSTSPQEQEKEDSDALPAGSSDFSELEPETAKALNILTDAVIRDYVKWWYSPILPSEITFPSVCRQTLTSFIVSLCNHLSYKRPADTFLDFVTNSSSIVIVYFSELSSALSASPNTLAAEALQTYLRAKPESNLANIVNQKYQQEKLHMVADDILESYLDSSVYRCSPTRIFLREILANTILDMTIQKCSEPQWINDWIVYLLEEAEPELLNVIDAGVENPTTTQAINSQPGDTPNTEASTARAASEPAKAQIGRPRRSSRAEVAMEEAMCEAQRLTRLIEEEDAKRLQEQQLPPTGMSSNDDVSDSNTHGIATPTSSQSEVNVDENKPFSRAVPTDAGPEERDVSASPAVSTFTNFDQLSQSRHAETLTLHRANISLYDEDGSHGDMRPLRGSKGKPQGEYLIQIEPASSNFPGWMIPRTYADFETLHEIVRRIATISGVVFVDAHANLPSWKALTKSQLREELERYLVDATSFEQLAESEGMKRFLDKDRGLIRSPGSKGGFWPTPAAFDKMGKGMFEALTKAPNQVAGGGKAIFGGVANVLGGAGSSGSSGSTSRPRSIHKSDNPSTPDVRRDSPHPRKPSSLAGLENGTRHYAIEPRWSGESVRLSAANSRPSLSSRSSTFDDATMPYSSLVSKGAGSSPSRPATPEIHLPPPPSDIPDDYASPKPTKRPAVQVSASTSHMSSDGTSFFDVPTPPTRTPTKSPKASVPAVLPSPVLAPPAKLQKPPREPKKPLSEEEAQVTIDLFFAVITELYNLSSAWNIRRTLLTAARTFLLRPGNPQLESIRLLIQESVLEANTSDAGLAGHILKLRENSMPTEDELKAWPPPLGEQEKEALRQKARKLLVEKGMPQALTSVMGAAASGEALGKVFDCLQVEDVARGLMFGLMLQGVKAVTQ